MKTISSEILQPLLSRKSYESILHNLKPGNPLFGHKTEKLCTVLIASQCADNILSIPYKIQNGSFEDKKKYPLHDFTSIREIIDRSLSGNDNDKSDITLRDTHNNIHPISVKTGSHGETPSNTDCTFLKDRLNDDYNQSSTLPILICDDKTKIINNNGVARGNKDGKDKQYHTDMILHDKIKDISDIKRWISIFHEKYGDLTLNEFIEKVDSEILNHHKSYLKIRLHQVLTIKKVMRLIDIDIDRNNFVIAHKPRSGKTYLILYLLNLLIDQGKIQRVLIWTSVKDTIKQFTDIINNHYDFNELNHLVLTKKTNIPPDFKGIVFTTCQYLKCDHKNLKKEFLEQSSFDCIVIDESHWGSSTPKTIRDIIHSIMKHCTNKLMFYLSATPRKTINKYNIPKECIFQWDITDEGLMKYLTNTQITDEQKDEIYDTMKYRHGEDFINIMDNPTIDCNYDNCPVPILISPSKHSMNELKTMISDYNQEYNTELGLSMKSLFSLESDSSSSKKIYKEEFQLSKTPKGKKLLIYFLEMIYNEDSQDGNTIYELIYETQHNHKSRVSSNKSPKLILAFLPDVGNIDILQKTLLTFIRENDLWEDIHVDYCNCKKSNQIVSVANNSLRRCKEENKEACIFFLNQQGGLGITYPHCDCVIMLDDSNNPEQYYQRIMRCMTENKENEEQKTCGIIVDFNWHRQLIWLNEEIYKKTLSHSNLTRTEAFHKLVDYNIFKINPRKHNKFGWDKQDISEYLSYISEEIDSNIDEEDIWMNWSCPDSLDIQSLIKKYKLKQNTPPENLNGNGLDIPLPSSETTLVTIQQDILTNDIDTDLSSQEPIEDFTAYYNKTEQFIKDRIAWIFALKMSKDKNIHSFEEVVQDDKCRRLIENMIDKSDINSDYDEIINSILYILNMEETKSKMFDLIQLYEKLSGDELRQRLDKRVIASEEERANNAEVHTCFELVDKLLDLIPNHLWTNIHRIADLSCGKGNIVRGIYSRFFQGLEETIPNPIERSKRILSECIYIADIEPINIFTTEFLLCLEAQADTGVPYTEFESLINSNEGNSLHLNIKEKWNIEGFDAIIENPPYNEKTESGKSKQGKKKLYSDFMHQELSRLNENGYLVYVTPLGWITGSMSIYNEVIKYNLEYINFHNVKEKYFPDVGDTLCYYSICKCPNKYSTTVIDTNGNQITKSFHNKKESKLFPVIFSEENLKFNDIVLTENTIYNKFINVKEWREGTRDNMIAEKSDEYSYEIREFKTNAPSKFTNIYRPDRYGKKFIIYEICGSFDCKYYDRNVYAGSHTFYIDILNDNYGVLLEKWFQTPLFKKLFDINKSSQYLKNGLVKHVRLPSESSHLLTKDLQNINLLNYQYAFYKIPSELKNLIN